jgi:hypothetical protein
MVREVFQTHEKQWQFVCKLEEEVTALPTLAATLNTMIGLVGM